MLSSSCTEWKHVECNTIYISQVSILFNIDLFWRFINCVISMWLTSRHHNKKSSIQLSTFKYIVLPLRKKAAFLEAFFIAAKGNKQNLFWKF